VADPQIPQGENLQRDGADAGARHIPLLLYFSQEHCGFCHRLEEEVLLPMVISGQYERRIILRELSIDEGTVVLGFTGTPQDTRMLFHEYDGQVTPTLVLTDGTGRLLTKPLAGINTVEYFGWYLDNAIDAATAKMRTSTP